VRFGIDTVKLLSTRVVRETENTWLRQANVAGCEQVAGIGVMV
jgi:hypothetical protein